MGAFGAVYLAEQLELGRQAACKILHPQFAREAALVDRFFREARAICEIGHRAIVTIENFGRLPSGEPFYLMELAPGRSLAALVATRWLTSAQLVDIFDPIADALRAAHAKRIIHRDLKPDNIMVELDGDRVANVRLLDFGIAKLLERDGAGSITGTVMGTPAFMAPEQAVDAKHVDQRADVYAFAATVYTAIARRPPFTDMAVAALLLGAQIHDPPALTALRPGAPATLDAAVARCLAKDRDRRPATIGDAWAEVRDALERHPLPVPGTAAALPAVAVTVLPDAPHAARVPTTIPPDVPTVAASIAPPAAPRPRSPVTPDKAPRASGARGARGARTRKRAQGKRGKRGARGEREKRQAAAKPKPVAKRAAGPRARKRAAAPAPARATPSGRHRRAAPIVVAAIVAVLVALGMFVLARAR